MKLCDFGFARVVNASNSKDLTDYVATRWYRAPELLLGSTNYTFAVDIWAIGCIMGEISDGQPLFPGESEIDQLFIVQKIIGPLTNDHLELFMSNPRFAGLKFPDMSRPETLQKKYMGKLSKRALSFMKIMLSMEPLERPNTAMCLTNAYFDTLEGSVASKQLGTTTGVSSISSTTTTEQLIDETSKSQKQSIKIPNIVESKHNTIAADNDWNLTEDHPLHMQLQSQQLQSQTNKVNELYDANKYAPEILLPTMNASPNIQKPTNIPAEITNDPPSRQKSRKSKEKEQNRAKELEKEAERERERQREKEIRAFREFSTKLPISNKQPQPLPPRRLPTTEQIQQTHQSGVEGGYGNYPHLVPLSDNKVTGSVLLGPLDFNNNNNNSNSNTNNPLTRRGPGPQLQPASQSIPMTMIPPIEPTGPRLRMVSRPPLNTTNESYNVPFHLSPAALYNDTQQQQQQHPSLNSLNRTPLGTTPLVQSPYGIYGEQGGNFSNIITHQHQQQQQQQLPQIQMQGHYIPVIGSNHQAEAKLASPGPRQEDLTYRHNINNNNNSNNNSQAFPTNVYAAAQSRDNNRQLGNNNAQAKPQVSHSSINSHE